jgi:zinc/manganese transport system substrate-binding protein
MTLRTALTILIAFAFAIAPAYAKKLNVVASFSILGDVVENIGGAHVEVHTLVGPDADAHVFEPTAADARKVATADILVMNGIGFDTWAKKLATSSGSRARIVAASSGLKPLQRGGGPDPHMWHDPDNVAAYAGTLARALAAADPPNAAAYNAALAAYVKELNRLDTEMHTGFAKIPKPQRRVITTHDAFGYLASAFDIAFIAPLGVSTDAQPSAKGVARLIDQIKREKITAVFVENITDPRLIQQIARETGVKIGGKLYSDALSTKAGPAPTYLALMRHNARLLTAAMAQGF